MKHNILLIAIALAAISWLLPQHAAATLDVATNLRKPFTIETTTTASGGRIEFRHVYETTGSNKNTINLEYRKSTDGGDSWGEWEAASISGTTSYKQFYENSITLSPSTSYTIQFRGYNPSGFSTNASTDYYRIILGSSSTAWNVTMSGNIMSLIVGYDTSDETAAQAALEAAYEIPSEACFFALFNNYVQTGVGSQGEPGSSMLPPVINAENLIFPATTLTNRCYQQLFYTSSTNNSGGTLISSYGGGLNEGPCFLATDFGSADYTFANAFWQCSSLNSAHFSFTSCPTNNNFNAYTVYSTPDSKTLYAPAGFNPTSCSIGTWNTVTAWSYDPSAEPGGGEGGDEPEEEIVSAPEAVNVYQAASANTTKILYNLDPKTGADGKTYIPVDMGYGVAWADRNVGATSSTDVGSYFYWGDTEGHTSFNANQDMNTDGFVDNQRLTPAQDAATQIIGTSWRTPTDDDWINLRDNCILDEDGGTFKNPIDNTNSVFLPTSGFYGATKNSILYCYYYGGNYCSDFSKIGQTYRFYWSNTFYYDGNTAAVWTMNNNGGSYGLSVATKIGNTNYGLYDCFGMPVRAVYEPSFTTHTLTVKAGNHYFYYICQEGQEITVTAVPDELYVFKWWSDDNSNTNATRTFTVNQDMVVEAVFTYDPSIPPHTATFYNYDGTQLYQTTVPEGIVPTYEGATPTKTYWEFAGWSPAITAMGNADITYTATFIFESAAASVDVYQNVNADTTKILYNLDPKTGKDGKTYIPVDMGYGVAWADRNVGATEPNNHGGWYQWGGTDDLTSTVSSGSGPSTGGKSTSNTSSLTAEEDAATVVMGTKWHMPTKAEWESLISNTTANASSRTFTNKIDGSKSIYLPIGGYYYNGGRDRSTYSYYWVNERSAGDVVYMLRNDNQFQVQNTDGSGYTLSPICVMPVRAVYMPTYDTRTLTITINDHQYSYICQQAQQITVTAVPQTSYVFDKWSDNDDSNATRTFTMYDNVAVEAMFKIDPSIPQHTATFLDWDGTELYQVEIPEGLSPVYSGSEPEREGYEFIGWTPAIAPMGDEDVVYTATYKKISLFTITNTHATQAMTVYLKRAYNTNYVPKPTVYVRITDANGNITYNWTAMQITGNSNVNVAGSATIPAGGKMEIYGNNTGFCSTSNNSNNCKFVISGGTAKLSGNLLSLVACSDGKTVNNDFTMPTNCFYNLFGANSVIVSAEDLELPSITLSQGCYWSMFLNCTGLVMAPKLLPATVMPPKCYYQMFQGCTALTRSPDIYGQTLTGAQNSTQTDAEASMFSGCTNLSHIRTYLATQWTDQTYHTSYWVSSVQTTAGSFYCPRTLDRITGGSNFIPSNWTIYSYNVTFVPVGGNWSDDTNENKQFTWRTDVSDVTGFMTEQTERVVDYYSDDQCTNKIADINTILTTRPSNDNTTYIYAKMAPTTNYYDITISTDPASGFGTVNTSSMNDVEEGTAISTSSNRLTIGETTITATPTASNEQYTYSFAGWTDNSGNALPDSVTADLDIRANFTQSKKQYNLTWNFNGGTTTEDYTNGLVEWGTPITAPTPTKDGCTFAGWDITPAATMPAATTTYTAQWTDCTISSLTLEDNRDATYYNTFANDYNGVDVETVTYNRTFAANTWSTVCLPFYVNADNLSGAGWTGKVFEFKHATGTADISEGLYLNFYPASEMEAGKGYLVYSQGAALEGGFEFYDVTIETDADTESAITDLVGYNDGQGTITLVGTLRQGTLTSNTRSQMALKDNKVWYPGSGTTTIRAYRGFFKDSSGSPIPPRVHIVVEGEVVTDLEVMDNGELRMENDNVRKYIEDGVLIIERNGIRYDAQGKRIEN